MKLPGAILILLGSLLTGREYARARRRELAALSSLCCALERMASELSARALPLPQLMSLLAEEAEEPAAAFFLLLSGRLRELGERSFRELWQEAARRALAPLSSREMAAVCELGAVLGRYPLTSQLQAIRRCQEALSVRREASLRRLGDDLRLGWGLSASLGFLLWILLI